MKLLYALFTGLVFGVGIAVSGMMDPAKVLNFFDVAGSWDPSLAFVMGGALLVRGDLDRIPEVQAAQEEVLVLKDLPAANDAYMVWA